MEGKLNQFQFTAFLVLSMIFVLSVSLIFTNLLTSPSYLSFDSFGPFTLKYELTTRVSSKQSNPKLPQITAHIKSKDISEAVLGGSTHNSSLDKGSSDFKALAWIPYWNQNTAFSSFQREVGLFDYLGVFWYVLRSDGTVKKYPFATEDQTIINFAHSRGVKVLAVVANLPAEDEGGDWDYKRVDKVISNSATRKKHISDLVNLAVSKNFDGINIDYEALKVSQKNNFNLFIEDLSSALHAKGKILGVSLHPKVGEGDPEYSNGSQAQDWRELAKYADHLYIMTYDEHWSTSPPGPLASITWVREVLTYAQTLIPSHKLFAGVPLDGYDWGGGNKAKGLTYSSVSSLINIYKPKINWDPKAKSHYFTYKVSGINHTVWYEDKDSFSAKLSLYTDMGLTNIAFWPLGYEDNRIWNALRNSP